MLNFYYIYCTFDLTVLAFIFEHYILNLYKFIFSKTDCYKF